MYLRYMYLHLVSIFFRYLWILGWKLRCSKIAPPFFLELKLINSKVFLHRHVYLMHISISGDLQKKIMKNKDFRIAPPVKLVMFKITPLYASNIIRLHDYKKSPYVRTSNAVCKTLWANLIGNKPSILSPE